MSETKQEEIEVSEIDLSDLYHYGIQIRACDMLNEILVKYENVEKLLTLNFSPDVGMEICFSDIDRETENMIVDMINKMEGKDEETFIEIAKMIGVEHIVYLLDGYEYAAAFIKQKEEDP
jgi:hypothetical protein